MHHALGAIAKSHDSGREPAGGLSWSDFRFQDTVLIRHRLAQRYEPATVNKMLSVLRGVLRHAWRLGYMDSDAFFRAVDFKNLRCRREPAGRRLSEQEIRSLLGACQKDQSKTGRRDAAILAVLVAAGLRRGELVALDLADRDARRRLLQVRHGKGHRQRSVYLSPTVNRLLTAWVKARGREDGPLFCPISRAGHLLPRRLRGESVGYLLRIRREEAKIPHFTAHDLRRTFISTLLDAGVDLLTVQELAGHADSRTTASYDRRGDQRKRDAARSIGLPH